MRCYVNISQVYSKVPNFNQVFRIGFGFSSALVVVFVSSKIEVHSTLPCQRINKSSIVGVRMHNML